MSMTAEQIAELRKRSLEGSTAFDCLDTIANLQQRLAASEARESELREPMACGHEKRYLTTHGDDCGDPACMATPVCALCIMDQYKEYCARENERIAQAYERVAKDFGNIRSIVQLSQYIETVKQWAAAARKGQE